MRVWFLAGLAMFGVAAGGRAQPQVPANAYPFAGDRMTHGPTHRIPITSTAFRGAFTLQQAPGQAFLVLEVDDQFNAYLNGKLAATIHTFTDGKARIYAVADRLRPGRNVIAVEAYSALDMMSLSLDIRADGLDGPVLISSGEAFRAAPCPAPPDMSWTEADYDDSAWVSAAIMGLAQPLEAVRAEHLGDPFAFPPEAYIPSLLPADYAFEGQWIQPTPAPRPGQEGAVFSSFTVDKAKYEHVVLYVTGDDRYMLYVNGTQLGWDWSPVSWNCGEVFDITDVLVDGPNFVTIRLRNDLPSFCAAVCEVWGLNGGDSMIEAAQRELLLASSPQWDSMLGNLYEDQGEVRKAMAIGKPPCEPWFTLKAIPCRLMPTNE